MGANRAIGPAKPGEVLCGKIQVGEIADGFDECFWLFCRAFHAPIIPYFGAPTTLMPFFVPIFRENAEQALAPSFTLGPIYCNPVDGWCSSQRGRSDYGYVSPEPPKPLGTVYQGRTDEGFATPKMA